MTIVDQFIDQNEQLLDQLNAENPSLGGAIAEALAVIDFYSKSNMVEFDEKRKEELRASPVAEIVEIKQEPQMEAVLKKIDEVVAESTPTTPIVESQEIIQPPAATPVATEMTPPSVETTMPTTPEAHTPTAPIVHESKEFVEDDILVSEEDLEALKQLEDLEDLTDINLDDLDI
jgi:hypothetical protein